MKINLKNGIDQLLFGMKRRDVVAVIGEPDKEYLDEEENAVALFNSLKLKLTFYEEEALRLGYLLAAHQDLEVKGVQLMGRPIKDVLKDLRAAGLEKWSEESYDTYENWFNEDHWLILQTEFGEVVKVELGAIINDKDEFDWKFKSK